MTEKEKPTLYEILLFLKDAGLVGEDHLALSLFTLLPNGGLVFLQGLSSTGKTNLLETVMKAYPNASDLFYEVSTSTSPTALFYDHESWNSASIHIWPDLTSMPESHEGIAKQIGDRKPADHTVTDVTIEDTKSKLLYPGRADIMVAASDNENFDKDAYAEVRNRSIQLFTDASQNLTEKILERKALEDANLYVNELDEERAAAVREYADGIMRFASRFDQQGGKFVNPAMPELTKAQVLPTLFPEARRDFGKLQRFMHSMALLNNTERIKYFEDGKPVLVVAPEDVWLSMKIFGEEMIMSSLNLSEEDIAIIQLLRVKKSAFTKSEIRRLLADPNEGIGLNITTRDVGRRLDGMCDRGYVNEDSTVSPYEYYAGMFASQIDHSTSLDWNAVLDAAAENARNGLPGDYGDDYVERFCVNPVGVHPTKGNTVVIREDDEFDGELAEATRDLDDAFSTPMWGADDEQEDGEDEEPSGGEASKQQGTLA